MLGIENNKDKIAILVVSCDRYADLWQPFFYLFFRFWPDCPYKIYLLSNKTIVKFSNVINIAIGEDRSWSDNLLLALKQIPEEYVLLHIEDLFLIDFVDSKKVEQFFNFAIKNNVNYLRMHASPQPDQPYNELVGVVSRGTIYRTSTVMSLWKKSFLCKLLKSGETAWDFEIYGTIRSDAYGGFYSSYKSLFPIINGVIKGKWRRSVVKKITKLGIRLNLVKRPVFSRKEEFKFMCRQLRSWLLNFIPAKYRRKIKECILGKKYFYKVTL